MVAVLKFKIGLTIEAPGPVNTEVVRGIAEVGRLRFVRCAKRDIDFSHQLRSVLSRRVPLSGRGAAFSNWLFCHWHVEVMSVHAHAALH
jgi:hypothetical protein